MRQSSLLLGMVAACVTATSLEARAADEPPPAAAEGEAVPAEPPAPAGWDSVWNFIKPSTKWYLHYEAGQRDGASVNRVHISRGYITLKLEPVEWFRPRVTLDTHQDDSGDFKVRLKYMYGKFVLPKETAVITEPAIEVGMVHGPWFDWEEDINLYRAEGKMPMERMGLLNSADLGGTVTGLLGEKLPEEYRKKVNKHYPGTWGSFAFGLYNGGGYHAEEANEGKVFAARLSLRPLGPVLPNLQLASFFLYGRGNTAEEPKWRAHNFWLSLESQYLVVAGQAGFGVGNQKGDQLDAAGDPLGWAGWSVFGEFKLPWIRSSLIGRYDAYDWGTDAEFAPTGRIIAGHAFHFLPSNYLLASIDMADDPATGAPPERTAKLTMQLGLW